MEKMNNLLETEESSSVFVKSVFRILNGIAAGFSGFLILFLVWTISTPFVGAAFNGDSSSISPVFYLVLLILVFLSTFGACLVNTFMTCLTLKSDYSRMSVSLYHTFLFNIVFFVAFVLLYFLGLNFSLEVASYIILAYVFANVLASSILIEVFGAIENVLLRIYEITIGALLGWFILSLLYVLSDGNTVILIFSGLPILLISINLSLGAIDLIYYWLYKGYGIDFLSINVTDNESSQSEDKMPEETKDVAGSDFIKEQ